jgi:hypothetical protein
METELKNFVKEHIVKQVNYPKPQATEQDVQLLTQAGFSNQARQIQTQLINATSTIRKDGIVLKIPQFKNDTLKHYHSFKVALAGFISAFTYLLIAYPVFGIVIVENASATDNIPATFHFFGLIPFALLLILPLTYCFFTADAGGSKYDMIKVKGNQYLFNCVPREYNGPVTTSVAQETIKARDIGLEPHVWFMATKEEVKNGLITPQKQVDPVLVGYGSFSRHGLNDGECILLAVWGDDLEDINQIFDKR